MIVRTSSSDTMWLLPLAVLCLLPTADASRVGQHENEVNKHSLLEDKLLHAVSNLRDHVLALQAELVAIKRKIRQSHSILRRLEVAGDTNAIGCAGNSDKQEPFSGNGRDPDVCSPDFDMLYRHSCYRVQSERVTWHTARQNCQINHSHLVAIESSDEQHYLVDHISSKKGIQHCDFWTGGTDGEQEGQWVWADTLSPLTYSHWHTGEPNNGAGREHCLWLDWYFGWQWNDASCDSKKACYICERTLPN